ncbi:hypothetical protein BFL34_01463 [Clavibacter michiganensis]|uniref:Uncharacterized protein n=1 Tax=Clavibacter michiganensis TaxID=28447 RepID=A0A251Y8R7_9MICO|nr:hypothetical protein [Clavibacter michiganensis]OUE20645.1 hypothetical protein BFL34_01463 [Clavibacter michiganensis]
MRITALTLAQALADGAAAAGLVLFGLLLTELGTGPRALVGLLILAVALVLRVVVAVTARLRLTRLDRGDGITWSRWIHLFWLVALAAFVGGLILAHTPVGVTASAVLAGAAAAIASVVLAGRAARSAGREVRFVDSGAVAAFA